MNVNRLLTFIFLKMYWSKQKPVFYNEIDQRVWRTSATTITDDVKFVYVGELTRTEFELLIEILYEKYGNDDISHERFAQVFGELFEFLEELKNK